MPSVHDVAAFVLEQCGPLRSAKLHELVYYSQAWSIGLRNAELFSEPIHAWARGPVVYELLEQHRNRYTVKKIASGASSAVSSQDAAFLGAVLSGYRKLGTRKLTELTRSEAPWQLARASHEASPEGSAEITPNDMRAYYGHAVPPFSVASETPADARPPEASRAVRAAKATGAALASCGRYGAVLLAVAGMYALSRRA